MQENVKISKIDKKRNKLLILTKKKNCFISFGQMSQISLGASNKRLMYLVDPTISSILQP